MKICVLPGDGIGPEIMAQAVRVLNALDRAAIDAFEHASARFHEAGLRAIVLRGDNRAESSDSLAFGPVAPALILGRVICTFP